VTPGQRLAIDLLTKQPEIAVVRAASVLFARHPEIYPNKEAARSVVKRLLGLHGKLSKRKAKTTFTREVQPMTRRLPQSKAKPWLPYPLEPGVVAVFGDLHFPKHSIEAIEAAVSAVKQRGKVDTVLLNGDIADAEEFGSWAKSPKAVDTENAVEIVRQGLLWFCEQFPESTIVYKMGNHEERLDRYCWSKAPELVGLPHITWEGLLKIGNDLRPIEELQRIQFVGEQRPVMAGKLTIFHGHELPKGLVNSVNPARGAFLRTLDSVVVNHHHRSSSHVEYDWRHRPINCWSLGCLCDLNPEYARINKWNWGFAIVDVSPNGDFSLENLKLLQDCSVVNA
jgi:predicted phosphodiesterase